MEVALIVVINLAQQFVKCLTEKGLSDFSGL